MKKSKVLLVLCSVFLLFCFGCASNQDKAYKAQEKVHEKRINLVNQYEDCLKKADKEDTNKDVCEQYLKAAEALK